MENNRTSQAFAEFSTKCIMTNELPGIPLTYQKYKRMEDALKKLVETCGHDKFTDNCNCKVAREALAFDPLPHD